MKTEIIETIDKEIAKHKDMAEKYLSRIEDCYNKEYSFINWLFSFIKPNKADKIKSYFKNYKYHKFAAAEFEALKSVVSREIQRLTKLKKNRRIIKAKVLETIDRQINIISQCMKSSQTGSMEYEFWLQLYYDYNIIFLYIVLC